jgi:hypothetical protein
MNSDICGNGLGSRSMAKPHSRQFGVMLRKQNHQRPIPPDARIHRELGSPHPKSRSSSRHRSMADWKDGQHTNPQVAFHHLTPTFKPITFFLKSENLKNYLIRKDFVTMESLTFLVLDPTLFRSSTNALKVTNTASNGG